MSDAGLIEPGSERCMDKIAAMEQAVVLQHTEYMRRLDELNHAHEQARADWQRALPREVHDGDIRRLESAIYANEKAVTNANGRMVGFGAAITIVLALLELALRFIGK